jgi:hypothetical protein
MMRRPVAALTLFSMLILIGCGVGAWFVALPPAGHLITPGASDIQIREVGLGQRTITYQATGGRYEWYFAVAGQLESSDWIPPDKWGPASQINTYTRVRPLWIGFLWEQVELHGEPNHARITMRRWVTIP